MRQEVGETSPPVAEIGKSRVGRQSLVYFTARHWPAAWRLFAPVVDFVEELGLADELAVYRRALHKDHVFVECGGFDVSGVFVFGGEFE